MLTIKDLVYSVSEQQDDGTEDRKEIIKGIDFTFDQGKFYAITGPNGSGKTTLSKLIMGIYKPDSGKIVFDGQELTSLSLSERARLGIAFSFQHPARFKGMSFRSLLGIAADTDDEEVLHRILLRVGLCSLDFLDKEVGSKLSGGEIKKVELATTIARNPRLAIYDEPDTGIDLWTIGPMVELLQKEQHENGTTTIVISHNEKFLQAADEVILLKNGKVVNIGSFNNTLPMLKDLDLCSWGEHCLEETDARCYR